MTFRIEGTQLNVSNEFHAFLLAHEKHSRIASYLMDSWAAESIVRVDRANHLDVIMEGDDAGKVSYLPPNRWDRHEKDHRYASDYDAYDLKGRMRGKPGSMIRKILKDEAFAGPIALVRNSSFTIPPLTDEDVLIFATAVQAAFQMAEPFLVTGEAIRYWYYEGNYTSTSNSMLHDSCMRYGENRSQIRFYAQNPRIVSMACLLGSDGKLAGRALVWNTPHGFIMDRRYGTDAQRRALVNFATQHGWGYRAGNNPGERTLVRADGTTRIPNMVLPIQRYEPGNSTPYFDTVTNIVACRKSGDMRNERVPMALERDRSNTFAYGGVVFGNNPSRFQSESYGRASNITRDWRVSKLSDFTWLAEWPAELLRTNDEWKLEDPENDTENWVLPETRSEAYDVAPPAPRPTNTDWMRTVNNTEASMTTRLSALRDMMNTITATNNYYRAAATGGTITINNVPTTYNAHYVPTTTTTENGRDIPF